jgi:hypothetical protein
MSFEPIRIGNTVIKLTSKSASLYEIKNEASPFLIKSISENGVVNVNVNAAANRNNSAVTIEAVDVLTMRDYLKRCRHATELYVALRLVHNLGKQMQALISDGRSIACLGVDDVVVITHRDSDAFVHDSINDPDSTLGNGRMDPQFLFLNDRLIFELDEDGTLIVDHALTKPKHAFMSPELSEWLQAQQSQAQQAQQSQAQLNFKTVYYSVAQLVIYFLLNVDRIPHDADDIAYLNPIKSTKLYWFLLRCLNPVPAQRKYIYI